MCLLKSNQCILLKTWKIRQRSERRSAVDVAHRIYGPGVSESKRHIIVLHGLLGSMRNWNSMCERITSATNACVIAADARNHGDSPHSDSHSYIDLAADISRLITKLAIQKAHIIGHSMGGRTAMALALSEPSKVGSLVIVDISPVSSIGLKDNFFPKLVDIMKTVNFEPADSLTKARNAAKDTIMASGIVDNVDGLGFVIMNIGQRNEKTFGWKYNLNALAKDFTQIATFPSEFMSKQYPGPTLLVAGGQSDYVPKSDEAGIKLLFPALELKYIDHVGHNVHAEDPKAFFEIIKEFLLRVLKD